MVGQYLRSLRHKAGKESYYDCSHYEEAEYPKHVPEGSVVRDRERRNGSRNVRGGIDMDLPRRHAVAKIPRDPRVRHDTKRSPSDLDITANHTVERDSTAVGQDALLHRAVDLNRSAEDIGISRDDSSGIQF